MNDRPTPIEIRPVPAADACAGYAVRDAIEGLLGGRRFILIAGDSSKGEFFSNMESKASAEALLALTLERLRAIPEIVPGVAVETIGQ